MRKLSYKNYLKNYSNELNLLSKDINRDALHPIICLGRTLGILMAQREEDSEFGILKSEILFNLTINNGCLTPTLLSRKINRPKGTISRAIRKLENDGFVIVGQPIQNDRRYKKVFITAKGIELVKEKIALRKAFAKEMSSHIGKEEFSTLSSLSQKYLSNLLDKIWNGKLSK